MIQDGTKRKCAHGEHDIVFNHVNGWHHLDRADWNSQPHKASPRKYKRKKA